MRTGDPAQVATTSRWRIRGSERARAWAGSPDGRAVAVLVAVPVLLYAVPAALGHPAVTGDNLIQNLPLRALTGRQLDQGHLPLWNPYIWSGSPLLGGLNAGSFYPFTFFFAVLAPVAAFAVNLLGVYWAGGLGMYALARQYGLRPVASFAGALTYAFSGTMSGQLVHLGVIQGMAWMPLLVLAELRLSWAVFGTRPAAAGVPVARRTSPWPWVALIALLVGLEALTGEPRAMAETELVSVAVALWVLLRPYGAVRVTIAARVRFAVLAALAGAWGVAFAAAELAPGWTFIEASQRAVESYQFFGSGSLHVSWSLLLVVPDLFGGSGHLGIVHYFNGYNLAEVTGYVGLLPLGAALALGARSFGRSRDARAADWGMWLALGGLGLLLAWGEFTPLGHIWSAIPLFGRTRLQSRNLEIVDLALAVLFAFWVDRALAERTVTGAHRHLWPGRRAWRDWLPLVPAAAAVVVCVITLAAPGPMEEWLQTSAASAALARRLWPWFLAQSVVAAGAIALVVAWRRLGGPARRRALVAVVVADLAFFAVATSTAFNFLPRTLEPTHAAAAGVLGTRGRFAVVDTSASRLYTLSAVGQPDLNAFTKIPSVQGYGSILSESYGAATGTHTLDTLSACALENGTFDQLRLSTLLVSPADLATATAASGVLRAPSRSSCRGAGAPGSAQRRTFYLGRPETLTSATLVTSASASASAPAPGAPGASGASVSGRLRLGILTARGATLWPKETVSRTVTGWSATFRRPVTAAGIVVEGPARAVADTSTVRDGDGSRWAFDGSMQEALGTPAWRYTGTWDGEFAVFRRTSPPRPPVWLARPTARSSVRQLSAPDWGGATDRVVAASPVTVVWSEAYQQGWHATLTPAGTSARSGPARPVQLDVRRDGLVQAVKVPAGTWLLTFSYRPKLLTLGLVGSGLAVLGFLALFGVTVARRRRRRRASGRAPRVGVRDVRDVGDVEDLQDELDVSR